MQEQMNASLTTNREFIEHAGSKGDSLEEVWLAWFRSYLPSRYSVDKAIVIDSFGNMSDQLDVVIYDRQYTPFVLNQNGFKYIPAEGVYAVFEVKPDLTGSSSDGGKSVCNAVYAGNKIASVRKLNRTSVSIINAGRKQEARHLTEIVGGLLANTNSATKKETFEEHLKKIDGLGKIDFACSLDTGSVHITYDPEYTRPEAGLNSSIYNDAVKNFYITRKIKTLEHSGKTNSLAFFFLKLTEFLQQRIGTVAAIDFNAYLDKTDEK